MSIEDNKIDRSYVDNYAVKEFTRDVLVPEYFPEEDISLRTSGMLGLTTELISNISEDTFNTMSVYYRETFPNRARLPESIYSHAALFQLSDIFSTAASSSFLLVFEESAIIENMQYDKDSGIYFFYVDKNTMIYIEDIPFTLDYDISIRVVKKVTETGEDYIFSASYMLDEYKNSISSIIEPYIKTRRSKNGFLALEVKAHQCYRTESYEQIVNNTKINFPIFTFSFDGKLAGFEVLYKKASEPEYTTQLKKLIKYTQPITDPFCYYELSDTNKISISFNTRDTYFMPDFNSEIKVIFYITNGLDGNFDVYDGNNISVVSVTDKYQYNNGFIMSAKPLTSSTGGSDQLELEALQAFAVEGYRTALALTTEDDLYEYFSNYKYRYGDIYVKFIKRRNDAYERLFGSFIVAKKSDDYIFKTNTLDLFLNLGDMKNPEKNVYTLDPGILFTYGSDDKHVEFLRNKELYDKYYSDYLKAVENNEIPFITDNIDHDDIPSYLDRPASYAEYKYRNNLDDRVSIFDTSDEYLYSLDKPQEGKFLFINPFLIRFKKSPNLVNLYLTTINQSCVLDYVNQNTSAFVQFVANTFKITRRFTKEKKYKLQIDIMSTISIDNDYPLIQMNGKEFILNDKFSVEDNDLRIIVAFTDHGKPVAFTELYPVLVDEKKSIIRFETEIFTDDHITSDGRMRLLENKIYRDYGSGEYYKETNDKTLYTKYDKNNNIIEENIPIDDVTNMLNNGELREHFTIHNMSENDNVLIPMTEVSCEIYPIYHRVYNAKEGGLVEATDEQTNNMFVEYDDSYSKYIWTNKYVTGTDPVTFIKPLNNVRSTLEFKDYTDVNSKGIFRYDIMDVEMFSLPFIRWNLMKDEENFSQFINLFLNHYENIIDIVNTRLRNETNVDIKFYNTYGRSKNYTIGDGEEIINTVNMKIAFDIWFIPGIDLVNAVSEVKYFIKHTIEEISENGSNHIHISNLMRKIEHRFAYVDHIRFCGINNYPVEYQSVKLRYVDMNDMSKDERRRYVPELLTIDLNDIIINEYYSS